MQNSQFRGKEKNVQTSSLLWCKLFINQVSSSCGMSSHGGKPFWRSNSPWFCCCCSSTVCNLPLYLSSWLLMLSLINHNTISWANQLNINSTVNKWTFTNLLFPNCLRSKDNTAKNLIILQIKICCKRVELSCWPCYWAKLLRLVAELSCSVKFFRLVAEFSCWV